MKFIWFYHREQDGTPKFPKYFCYGHKIDSWWKSLLKNHLNIKVKLLGEISRYDLYYSLKHTFKWKSFGLETCTDPHYLVLNFYQINRDDEIRIRDHLVIKALIPCQRIISTQKFKLLGKISKYNLYYSLTIMSF
jgi:hypothetical protein